MSLEEIEAHGGYAKMPYQRRRKPDPEVDFAYSEFHRPGSTARFLTIKEAEALKEMDLDGIEIDPATDSPCAYVEATEKPVNGKQARWTKNIAAGAPAPPFVVQVVLSPLVVLPRQQAAINDVAKARAALKTAEEAAMAAGVGGLNPAVQWGLCRDIESFVVKDLSTGEVASANPATYARWLVSLRGREAKPKT